MKGLSGKTLHKVILLSVTVLLSFCMLIGTVMAWFIMSRDVATPIGDLSVGSYDIVSAQGSFYRGDGVRYDLTTGNSYDNDNRKLNVPFSMLEYDTIITEKNRNNNLILTVKLKFDEAAENRTLHIDVSTLKEGIFGDNSGGIYHLSDVIKIAYAIGVDYSSATTNAQIYTAATGAFGSVADADKKRFVTITDTDQMQKTRTCSFVCDVPSGSDTLTLTMNVEYDEILVRKLYGEAYGQFDWTSKDRLTLQSDLRYTFLSEVGAHD